MSLYVQGNYFIGNYDLPDWYLDEEKEKQNKNKTVAETTATSSNTDNSSSSDSSALAFDTQQSLLNQLQVKYGKKTDGNNFLGAYGSSSITASVLCKVPEEAKTLADEITELQKQKAELIGNAYQYENNQTEYLAKYKEIEAQIKTKTQEFEKILSENHINKSSVAFRASFYNEHGDMSDKLTEVEEKINELETQLSNATSETERENIKKQLSSLYMEKSFLGQNAMTVSSTNTEIPEEVYKAAQSLIAIKQELLNVQEQLQNPSLKKKERKALKNQELTLINNVATLQNEYNKVCADNNFRPTSNDLGAIFAPLLSAENTELRNLQEQLEEIKAKRKGLTSLSGEDQYYAFLQSKIEQKIADYQSSMITSLTVGTAQTAVDLQTENRTNQRVAKQQQKIRELEAKREENLRKYAQETDPAKFESYEKKDQSYLNKIAARQRRIERILSDN